MPERRHEPLKAETAIWRIHRLPSTLRGHRKPMGEQGDALQRSLGLEERCEPVLRRPRRAPLTEGAQQNAKSCKSALLTGIAAASGSETTRRAPAGDHRQSWRPSKEALCTWRWWKLRRRKDRLATR